MGVRARSAHGSDEDSPLMKGAKGAGSPPGSPEPKLPPGGRAARLLGGGRWKLALLAAGALLVLYPLLRGGSHAQDTSPENYVRVNRMQFEHQCRPFYVAGFNVDNVAQAPITALARKNGAGFNGRRLVRDLLNRAAAAGLNVMRTWAHTSDPAFPFQVKPGVYSEDAFRALDYVVAEAGKAGLKVVLSLVDNWKYAGGVDEFVDWSPNVPERDPRYPPINKLGDVTVEEYGPERLKYENLRKANFFRDPACRDMYRNHVTKVLTRRNVYTGLEYREDPTILGWNLINEPRCSSYETPECPALLTKWVEDMASHIKGLDKRHLITVGAEGFWGEHDVLKAMNPGAAGGSDWASRTGQDFATNHASPTIDYATVHMWPDNWAIHNHSFHRAWLERHIEESASVLRKPILLEEFGKVLGRGHNPPPEAIKKHRNPVFEMVYGVVDKALSKNRALVGSLYWRWGFNVYANDLPGPYGVLPEHSTFDLVAQHAQRVRQRQNSVAPRPECDMGCWVGESGFGGLIRRCKSKPAVCEGLKPPSAHGESKANAGTPQVFATKQDCCRPGLGAFEGGCTTPW